MLQKQCVPGTQRCSTLCAIRAALLCACTCLRLPRGIVWGVSCVAAAAGELLRGAARPWLLDAHDAAAAATAGEGATARRGAKSGAHCCRVAVHAALALVAVGASDGAVSVFALPALLHGDLVPFTG